MKHKLLILVGLALLTVVTGCKKEEKQVKHVSKVYTSLKVTMNGNVLNETPRYLMQEWIWTGDKLTSKKHYSSDGSLLHETTISYIDGRMSKIEDYYEEINALYRTDIEYNADGKVVSTKEYSNDVLVHAYTYEYNGSDKITNFTYVHTVDGNSSTKVFNVEWTGNNITGMSSTTEPVTTETFTYDNHPNPYYGLIASGDVNVWASENNVISVDGNARTCTYDSDGWPIKFENVSTAGATSISSTIEFEYYQ